MNILPLIQVFFGKSVQFSTSQNILLEAVTVSSVTVCTFNTADKILILY